MKRVTTSPHVHSSMDIRKSMLYVFIALLPSAIWGVVVFGLMALVTLALSIASAVLTEYLLSKVTKEEVTINDMSAAVTGLLIGMNMPPHVPFYIPVLASVFAIIVVKWSFGGLGCNWMNPALGGRVFVFFSFTSAMSAFSLPRFAADAASSATPLSSVKTLLSNGEVFTSASEMSGYPVMDAFIGNIPGCIGEVSALLLIAGGLFLIYTKVMTWHIPVSYIGSFAFLTWVFSGLRCGQGFFIPMNDLLMALFTGGLMLGAIFMATDWVTTPTTPVGMIVFGIGCGFFTFLIRYFGSLPEGVSLAIILMNVATPTIERYIKPKKFGYVKPVKAPKEAKK